jgi:hypothetical protein
MEGFGVTGTTLVLERRQRDIAEVQAK